MMQHVAFLFLAVAVFAGCVEKTRDGSAVTDSAVGNDEIVRQQIAGNWVVDAGMAGLEDLVVRIIVDMDPDGSVRSAKIDGATNNGNPNWPIFAGSCRRAVLKSSPLRMSPDKPYEEWKRMTLNFTGREVAGQ